MSIIQNPTNSNGSNFSACYPDNSDFLMIPIFLISPQCVGKIKIIRNFIGNMGNNGKIGIFGGIANV